MGLICSLCHSLPLMIRVNVKHKSRNCIDHRQEGKFIGFILPMTFWFLDYSYHYIYTFHFYILCFIFLSIFYPYISTTIICTLYLYSIYFLLLGFQIATTAFWVFFLVWAFHYQKQGILWIMCFKKVKWQPELLYQSPPSFLCVVFATPTKNGLPGFWRLWGIPHGYLSGEEFGGHCHS